MLRIAATGEVAQFIKKYETWVDYQNFYNGLHEPVVAIDPQGISCYHYMELDSINSHGSRVIAIDALTEGIHCAHHFEKFRPDNYYLIFANGHWDPSKYLLSIEYTQIPHLFFLFELEDMYLSPNRFGFYIDKDYKFDYPKNCNWVSTIGNKRAERDYIVEQLQQYATSNKYILRYSGQDLGKPSKDVIPQIAEFDPYTKLLDKYYHTISHTLPIDLYNQAYFNVVVESDLDWQDEFFLTEKTIKCLITGMPFVIISTPGFLKELQQLGFKTYHAFWDEGYDKELDFQTRVNRIANLCAELEHFDWKFFKTGLEEVGRWNQHNFMRLEKLASKEFRKFESIIGNYERRH